MIDRTQFNNVLGKIKDETEDELKAAGKEIFTLGRDAFDFFVKEVKDLVSDDDMKTLAKLYAKVEVNILSGKNTVSSRRIITRLNLVSTTIYHVKKSRAAKKAMETWKSSLKVLGSVVGRLASIGSGGLTDLIQVGVSVGQDLLEDVVEDVKEAVVNVEPKAKSKPKAKTKKKTAKKAVVNKNKADDEDIVVVDED